MGTGIVILNYNNAKDTINCVRAVEKYNTAFIKYVVVDNGSSQHDGIDSLDLFFHEICKGDYLKIAEGLKNQDSHELPKMTFLCCEHNTGYANGNNKGLELFYKDSDIDTILILNNDILFIQDIIPALHSFLDTRKDAAIVSPVLYKNDAKEIDYNCARTDHTMLEMILTFAFWGKDIFGVLTRLSNRRFLLLRDPSAVKQKSIPIELPSGACMMIKKELFYRMEGFDPNTFLYYEENILYKKISRLNLKNYLLPSAGCIHLGASSIKSSPKGFIARCSLDSALYYAKTYCKLRFYHSFLLYAAAGLFRFKLFIQRTFGRHPRLPDNTFCLEKNKK